MNIQDCSRLESHIDDLQKQIDDYRLRIDQVKTGKRTKKIDELLRYIGSKHYIVLATDNMSTNPQDLTGEEAVLWNNVLEEYPDSILEVIQVYKLDGCSELEYVNDDNYSMMSYYENPSKHKIGQIVKEEVYVGNMSLNNFYDHDWVTLLNVLTIKIIKPAQKVILTSSEPIPQPLEPLVETVSSDLKIPIISTRIPKLDL